MQNQGARRDPRAGIIGCMIGCFILCSPVGTAQFLSTMEPPYESDVLSARPIRYFLGIMGGGYAFQHLGSFSPKCNCVFSDEDGSRLLVGLEFSIRYPKLGFALKLMGSYRDYSATFSRRSVREEVIVGSTTREEVEFENMSNVRLRSVGIMPAFAWYVPASEIFFYAGIDVGIPVEARYDHRETIRSEGFLYYDGSDTHILLAEHTSIPGGRRVKTGLAFGLGADLRLSDRLYLAPTAGLIYPLTSVSTTDASWKVMNEHAMVILKLRLN